MAFDPDIIVTQSDSCLPLLIAEVKLREDLPGSESQLKKYMWEMSCPVGLLVFPRRFFVYRNQYTGYSEDSVLRIGPFSTPDYLQTFEHTRSESVFQGAVQQWLETIRVSIGSEDASPGTREALSEHVIPSLINGEVHAAHPRAIS